MAGLKRITQEARITKLVAACREVLNEIRAYQGEGEFEDGNPTKHLCDTLKEAIAFATGDQKDFAQLSHDTPLSPEEDAALQKATKQLFAELKSNST